MTKELLLKKPTRKELPPLSLYIHIPWCERKCPYCDFNSHESKNQNSFDESEYINCLIKDFQNDITFAQGRSLQSIFIGGGTPSLFGVKSISRLLQSIQKEINFSPNIEITLEANPASSQNDYFSELSETLVNRVSLGVQSFQSDKLKTLGRLHSGENAQQALLALKNNFLNFNVDLMFGLPKQTIKDSLFDLETALSFSPAHLSWYQLTIEPNTVFFRNTPTLPNEDSIFDMQQEGKILLESKNLNQYEVSAFSKHAKGSLHNMNYWQFGDYLAIGAGAHGKISQVKNDQLIINRFQKTRSPKDYLANAGSSYTAKQETIPESELALEFFMNSFRLNQASSLKQFYQRTDLSFEDIKPFCEKAESLKLISIDDIEIQKTELGERHLDTLLGLF